MGLPKIKLPTKEVLLSDGSAVEVRGLTRAEVLELQKIGQEDQSKFEPASLEKAIEGVTAEEAAAWIASTPFGDVDAVLQAILDLSGIEGGAEKKE